MTQASMPKNPRNRSILRRAGVLLAVVSLLLVSLVQVNPSQADALSNYDAEILRLVNNHRGNLGLNPLVEYAPLSDAALDWSATMRNDSGSPCGSAGRRHDTPSNIASKGMPAGTSALGANIAFACGTPGAKFGISWSYNRMPSNCPNSIDYTSALMMFCVWVDSALHREAIENPAFTHIGVGSAFANDGNQRSAFSTTRFATAPVAPTSCNGKRATVNLSTGQSPTNQADVILGTAGADVINGLGGNDIICGFGGNDRITGGPGDDTIFGGDGNDNLQGNDGRDILHGENGDDTLSGGELGDQLNGNNGNDTLNGDGGWDRIWGHAGVDTIRGGSGGDKIFGGNDGDNIFGDGGPDVIDAGSGNDTVDAGNGQDMASGGTGNDQLSGSGGPDQLWGNDGADTIRGGRGGDSLYGQWGNDRLIGEGGWDTLDGGGNIDQCDGGYGRDTAGACETRISVP